MIVSPVAAPFRITQRFGERPEFYARFELRGHNGIDFTGKNQGEPVDIFTPYDCQVVEVQKSDQGYGNMVRVETAYFNGKKRQLVFGHLSDISVSEGQFVDLGDKIGVMGNTGESSGLHLHLGLRYIDAQESVLHYDNGYEGYVDFGLYILPHLRGDDAKKAIVYP
ncbi:hypothetical protein A3D11_04310 [Candidatus Peribacteria bacterium RIFCSPHIGHO2_02_FULL_49_16]|nr:MAG: hypothetical protein A3D11_04310 [Candidatus Peribacteria bacterium RIFCSPHIGHO2_02_FULL_49_16]